MKLIHQKIIKKEILHLESENLDENGNHIKNIEIFTVLTLDNEQIFKTSIDIKEKEGDIIAFISNDENQIESLLTSTFEKKLKEETRYSCNTELFFKFLICFIYLFAMFLPLIDKNIPLIPCVLLTGGMFLNLIFAFKIFIKDLIDFKKEIKIKKEILYSIMNFKNMSVMASSK